MKVKKYRIKKMECKIKNLTPHEIVLFLSHKKITIPPEPNPLRLKEEIEKVGSINIQGEEISIIKKKLIAETELPPREEGTYYIVSLAVAQSFPERDDFLVIGESVRDEQGRIIGAKSLAVIEWREK